MSSKTKTVALLVTVLALTVACGPVPVKAKAEDFVGRYELRESGHRYSLEVKPDGTFIQQGDGHRSSGEWDLGGSGRVLFKDFDLSLAGSEPGITALDVYLSRTITGRKAICVDEERCLVKTAPN